MTGRDAALRWATGTADAIATLCPGVRIDPASVLDRSDAMTLMPPGAISANGSCRLIAAQDGWIAVNLPRPDDEELVPAWLGCDFGDPVWPTIGDVARREPAAALVNRGAELGLAVARLRERAPASPIMRPFGDTRHRTGTLRVLDLSSLWAGPLCAGILAGAGHDVVKVESHTRPDPIAHAAPEHDARLNSNKRRLAIPFTAETLGPLLRDADVIVTSARSRAFAALGLSPETLFASKPGLVWVAITAHGWTGEDGARVGFGDDAAVAGVLVDWQDGAPLFAGDALADPLTGLAAARATLEALEWGGGVLIDASLAATAALVAQQ